MPLPTTKPFFFQGGSSGCLLVHGYSGSPNEVRGLGEHLATRGYTVLGVCLAGHGSTPEAFYRSRGHEWLGSVETGYDELARYCEHIVHVGFSMGGVLGLLLAQRRRLAGLVTMGSRVRTTDSRRFYFAPLLSPILSWRDPSLPALVQLRELVQKAQRTLPLVHVPTLVMHGREDTVVHPRNAGEILAGISSTRKDLAWWEDTGHQMLTEGPHRAAIFARVTGFVEECLGAAHLPAAGMPIVTAARGSNISF